VSVVGKKTSIRRDCDATLQRSLNNSSVGKKTSIRRDCDFEEAPVTPLLTISRKEDLN